ncbi:hypothetical protein AB6G21_07340 [Providencia hangzhouensis]
MLGFLNVTLFKLAYPLGHCPKEITRSLNNANITNSEQEAIIQRIKKNLDRKKNSVQLETHLASSHNSMPQGFAQSEYSDIRYTVFR